MAELSRQNDRRSEHDVTAGINGMSPTKSRDANALNFLGPSPAALSASLQRLDRVVLVVVAAAVEGAAAVVVVLALALALVVVVVVVLVLVVVVVVGAVGAVAVDVEGVVTLTSSPPSSLTSDASVVVVPATVGRVIVPDTLQYLCSVPP